VARRGGALWYWARRREFSPVSPIGEKGGGRHEGLFLRPVTLRFFSFSEEDLLIVGLYNLVTEVEVRRGGKNRGWLPVQDTTGIHGSPYAAFSQGLGSVSPAGTLDGRRGPPWKNLVVFVAVPRWKVFCPCVRVRLKTTPPPNPPDRPFPGPASP